VIRLKFYQSSNEFSELSKMHDHTNNKSCYIMRKIAGERSLTLAFCFVILTSIRTHVLHGYFKIYHFLNLKKLIRIIIEFKKCMYNYILILTKNYLNLCAMRICSSKTPNIILKNSSYFSIMKINSVCGMCWNDICFN